MRTYYHDKKGFHAVSDRDKSEWVDVVSPDSDDMRYLIEEEEVPPILLEYLEDRDERARIERNGDWHMTIVRIPIENDNDVMPYTTVPMGIISRDSGRVLTVCFHPTGLTAEFACHTCRKELVTDSVSQFTLRIFFTTAYLYLADLKKMSSCVIDKGEEMEHDIENKDLRQLMKLQKSLVFFNTSINGDMLVLERIRKIYEADLDEDLAEDVEIEMRQAETTAGISNDILKATMDSYASIISNNANNVMKRMSALSIILIVPTFVASLYGMNVDILLTSRYSFWIILGIAAVLTSIAFVCLRRLKWI